MKTKITPVKVPAPTPFVDEVILRLHIGDPSYRRADVIKIMRALLRFQGGTPETTCSNSMRIEDAVTQVKELCIDLLKLADDLQEVHYGSNDAYKADTLRLYDELYDYCNGELP